MKCEDIVILDVTGQSPVCDFIVVATGTSVRQMKSVAQSLEDMGKEQGNAAYRSSRDTGTTWVVVDFVETVIHLFESEQRLYYDIEALWQSGTQVDWQREDHE